MTTVNNYQEQIFFKGFDYFKSLLNDIEQATHSIDLETYIFLQDALGQKILAALRAASARKVKVRLLIDGAGTPDWNVELAKQLEQEGIKNRIFHPFPWRSWQWSLSKVNTPFLQKFLYLLFHMNSRNHRKTCIIDNKIAYIGSFNIRGNYFDETNTQEHWRDTGVRLQGLDLAPINEAFVAAWNHFPIKKRISAIFHSINANSIFRLNNTWHRRHFLYNNLLQKIKFCKNRIWITNAYFVPDNFLLKRLKAAAQRKIDVRILLPKKADIAFMPWASSAFYQQLIKTGIRIFEYLPNLLHAKTLIIDDWMLLGSSNLNYRSLLHDLELDVNIQTPETKRALEQQFLIDIKNAEEVHLDYWQKRPWHQRFVGRLVLYIKYLI